MSFPYRQYFIEIQPDPFEEKSQIATRQILPGLFITDMDIQGVMISDSAGMVIAFPLGKPVFPPFSMVFLPAYAARQNCRGRYIKNPGRRGNIFPAQENSNLWGWYENTKRATPGSIAPAS